MSGGTRIEMAEDVQLLGYETESRTQQDLYQEMRDLTREVSGYLEQVYALREGMSDRDWEGLGHCYGQLTEVTRRMIVRRREDAWREAAESFATAISGEYLRPIELICLMSGRVEELAQTVIDDPDENRFMAARALAPVVVAARHAMATPIWGDQTGTRPAKKGGKQ